MRQKPDTVAIFEQFLAEEWVAGTPSVVKVIRSHGGGGDLKETLQNSVGGTTSVRKSLLLIAQILTG